MATEKRLTRLDFVLQHLSDKIRPLNVWSNITVTIRGMNQLHDHDIVGAFLLLFILIYLKKTIFKFYFKFKNCFRNLFLR
jgi:hypothetical protein